MALINDSGANDLFAALTVLSDPKALAERLTELKAAEASHTKKITALKGAQAKFAEEQQKIDTQKTALEIQVQSHLKQQKMLADAMAKLNKDEATYSDKVGKLKAEVRDFEEEKRLNKIKQQDAEAQIVTERAELAVEKAKIAEAIEKAEKAQRVGEAAKSDAELIKVTYEEKLKALKAMF